MNIYTWIFADPFTQSDLSQTPRQCVPVNVCDLTLHNTSDYKDLKLNLILLLLLECK